MPAAWWPGSAVRRPSRTGYRGSQWRSAGSPAGSCTARRSSSPTVLPHVMSGSSNFTYAGLATNRELNLGQFNPGTVGRGPRLVRGAVGRIRAV